jgi:hypothetical protein
LRPLNFLPYHTALPVVTSPAAAGATAAFVSSTFGATGAATAGAAVGAGAAAGAGAGVCATATAANNEAKRMDAIFMKFPANERVVKSVDGFWHRIHTSLCTLRVSRKY